MDKQPEKEQSKEMTDPGSAESREGVDKAPGEEKSKSGKLSKKDLKGKKIDADPSREQGRPAH